MKKEELTFKFTNEAKQRKKMSLAKSKSILNFIWIFKKTRLTVKVTDCKFIRNDMYFAYFYIAEHLSRTEMKDVFMLIPNKKNKEIQVVHFTANV